MIVHSLLRRRDPGSPNHPDRRQCTAENIHRDWRDDPFVSASCAVQASKLLLTDHRRKITIAELKALFQEQPKEVIKVDSLPSDILTMIFEELEPDTDTIHGLRLVCRRFEQVIWPVFAKSFNKRIFHPTTQSLENLLAFSSCLDAQKYLRKLNISTITLEDADARKPPIDVVRAIEESRSVQPRHQHASRVRRDEIADHLQQPTPSDVDLVRALVTALSRLKSLTHICVRDGSEV